MNKNLSNCLEMYKDIISHISYKDKFKITRRKTSTCDNLPFELIELDFVYEIFYSTHKEQLQYYVSEFDLEHEIERIGSWALVRYGFWGEGYNSVNLHPVVREVNYKGEGEDGEWGYQTGYILETDWLVETHPELKEFEDEGVITIFCKAIEMFTNARDAKEEADFQEKPF